MEKETVKKSIEWLKEQIKCTHITEDVELARSLEEYIIDLIDTAFEHVIKDDGDGEGNKREKKHSEAIGKFKIKGGEFDGICVEFMGFCGTNNVENNTLSGLYAVTEYCAFEIPYEYIDWSTIVWYCEEQKQKLLEYKIPQGRG